MPPKISVIVPVYNTGEFLREAIQSITNQHFDDMEIIVVNDGSTDNSVNIIREIMKSDLRIKLIEQKNQGQSAARNTALKVAEGKYIYFMDSDDVLHDNAFETCYKYAERNDAEFCFFDGDIIYEEGAQELTWNYIRTIPYSEDTAYNGRELFDTMLDNGTHRAVPWLLFIRRDYLNEINLRFFSGIIHEDELFTTLLTIQSGKVFCLKKGLVHHRVRKGSTMGKKYSLRNVSCYLTVIDELMKFEKSDITEKYARYTLSKIFYTAHTITFSEKIKAFTRAATSGYLKYIGFKSCLVFWLKQ